MASNIRIVEAILKMTTNLVAKNSVFQPFIMRKTHLFHTPGNVDASESCFLEKVREGKFSPKSPFFKEASPLTTQ